MIKRGIAGEAKLKLDTRELDRGGVSYTVDTLKSFGEEDELFLIIGLDQFQKFDQWKDYESVLTRADLVVTSRPGNEMPYTLDDWPVGVRNLVGDADTKNAVLKTGRNIHFIQLEDVDVSATEIRKKIRLEQSIVGLVPPSVDEYIREQGLYNTVGEQIGDFEKFAAYCEKLLLDKGGVNVKTYDLRERNTISEFTVICSGTSTRHASALAEHLMREVKKDYGVWPVSIEGQTEGRWIVVDYGALIAHVFYDFVRQEYRLEELWTK